MQWALICLCLVPQADAREEELWGGGSFVGQHVVYNPSIVVWKDYTNLASDVVQLCKSIILEAQDVFMNTLQLLSYLPVYIFAEPYTVAVPTDLRL